MIDCLKENADIDSSLVEELSMHNDVTGVKECKEKYCKQDSQCGAFVFDSAKQICYLKKAELSMENAAVIIGQIKDTDGKTLGLNNPMLNCKPIIGKYIADKKALFSCK